DGIRDGHVTGVQTCALPISLSLDKTLEIVTESAREVIGSHHCAAVLALEQNWGRARHVNSFSDKYTGREEEFSPAIFVDLHALRSEERRVGKECRSGGWECR